MERISEIGIQFDATEKSKKQNKDDPLLGEGVQILSTNGTLEIRSTWID